MKGIRTDAFSDLIQNKFEGETMSEPTPVSKTIYNYPPKARIISEGSDPSRLPRP